MSAFGRLLTRIVFLGYSRSHLWRPCPRNQDHQSPRPLPLQSQQRRTTGKINYSTAFVKQFAENPRENERISDMIKRSISPAQRFAALSRGYCLPDCRLPSLGMCIDRNRMAPIGNETEIVHGPYCSDEALAESS